MQNQLSLRSMSAMFVMAIALIAFVAFASPPNQAGGSGVDGTCSGQLWNGTTKTDDCPTDCSTPPNPEYPQQCFDHWENVCDCFEDGVIGTTCIRVCNQSGQVIDIQCVCHCPDTPIDEPNCPPN